MADAASPCFDASSRIVFMTMAHASAWVCAAAVAVADAVGVAVTVGAFDAEHPLSAATSAIEAAATTEIFFIGFPPRMRNRIGPHGRTYRTLRPATCDMRPLACVWGGVGWRAEGGAQAAAANAAPRALQSRSMSAGSPSSRPRSAAIM
ncbi:hypothetical protein GCM10023068_13200 [Leifsonia shinshuensis]